MPSWKLLLQIIVLIALGGFFLTVLSAFWHLLALLIVALALAWLWRNRPAGKN